MTAAAHRRIPVVGAVIVHAGEVYCARRGTGELAGLWEFPGGKVEPGESPSGALVREIREELGCIVEVGEPITTTEQHYDFAVISLTTFYCRLVEGSPQLSEHTEDRWLAPATLTSLSWAPADLPTAHLVQAEAARQPTSDMFGK